MNDDPAAAPLAPLVSAGLVEHVGTATTIPGPARRGALQADKFSDVAQGMWTHRFRGRDGVEYSLYDHIWTTPDLTPKITATSVMRRTQISGDASDHDPAAIDIDL